ncbi:DNA polymerase zeta subunit 2 [Uranotaenia lowii]|uniref:DNA polymerase zeta subunit 2 n=1 Tax=Uranotaenia lowii TaxID=190385 RepID=UPI00247A32E3|nr:DNA polymerase zeta subunit 2 [Uranotaenia lowii]
MDGDIIIVLLEIYINAILQARELYPAAVFRKRKAFNIPVWIAIFNPLNEYLKRTLCAAVELKRAKKLTKVELLIYQEESGPLENYVFELEDLELPLATDEHMFELEDHVRKSLLNFGNQLKGLKRLSSAATFKLLLHTTEAAHVRLAANPKLQDHPFVRDASGAGFETNKRQLLPLVYTPTVGLNMYVQEFL